MASRKKHHKLGQLWAEGDMTERMQSEPLREGREEGREEVKQGGVGGWGCEVKTACV